MVDGKDEFNEANPKIGVMWNPTPHTTLRLAAFKVLKRSLVANQAIEPTQVAGFNQFFDDFRSTESIRYGIGLDQKFSSNLYGGFEFSKRDLRVPVSGIPESWEEKLYRAYLNWTPNLRWAASVEYKREDFKNFRSFFPPLPPDTKTQFLPVVLSYYAPSGFFAQFETIYVNQRVELFDLEKLFTFTDGDEFVLIDAAIGYRLPKRYGIFNIGVKNLLNNGFKFQGFDGRIPTIQGQGPGQSPPFLPERTIFAQFTLAF